MTQTAYIDEIKTGLVDCKTVCATLLQLKQLSDNSLFIACEGLEEFFQGFFDGLAEDLDSGYIQFIKE